MNVSSFAVALILLGVNVLQKDKEENIIVETEKKERK